MFEEQMHIRDGEKLYPLDLYVSGSEPLPMAQRVAEAMGRRPSLVPDTFFAVGPVFVAAPGQIGGDEPLVQILIRATKNVVGYRPAQT